MEYAVPVDVGLEAAAELQELIRKRPDPAYPLFLRWIKGDDAMISPFAGRDSVALSIGAGLGEDYAEFFQEYHELIAGKYEGRPHWGKMSFFTRSELEHVLPRHGEFVDIRRQFDPRGIFLNDFLRNLFE